MKLLLFFIIINSFYNTVFSHTIKRNIFECEISVKSYSEYYKKALSSPDREKVCAEAKSNLGYRMFSESVKVLPGCDDEDNFIAEYYSKNLEGLKPLIINTFEYYCTKDENGNYCPMDLQNDSLELEKTCKSKKCTEAAIIYASSYIDTEKIIKKLNPQAYPTLGYDSIKKQLYDLKLGKCPSSDKNEDNSKTFFKIFCGIIVLVSDTTPLISPTGIQVIYSPYQQGQFPVINNSGPIPQIYMIQPAVAIANPNANVTSPSQDANLPTYNQVMEEVTSSLAQIPSTTVMSPSTTVMSPSTTVISPSTPVVPSSSSSSRSENTSNIIEPKVDSENTSNIIDAQVNSNIYTNTDRLKN
ncbi:hypothetical protein BCR32DRAFT_273220 [Anaeromyces robustus]|uniref:Uncharacterized protein n=1 Tax=Anaeromyces robustus TaxID=1754192 RepID=A0A1Y1VSW0_9FUNG|nr:hypothetical protein BCR32DRAFT_273220 [Anaeromyces robustus]|eukprot:ORX64115.1 hypothetical protein BCR32DRAFT_273220 [Anaeromyces robustus]